MITKNQIIDSLRHEIAIIKHLATKVPAGTHDWRPTPEQRSTLELMRYLTVTSISAARYFQTGNWDHGQGLKADSQKIVPETFAAAMDQQLRSLEEWLGPLTDADAERESLTPWGTRSTLGLNIIDSVLKPLVGYRMQLFLYAKQSGNQAITSYDCWAGLDTPPAKPT